MRSFWRPLLLLSLLSACAGIRQEEPRLDLAPIGFDQLTGWEEDDQSQALAAFLRSCEKIEKRGDGETIGKGLLAAPASLWKEACRNAPAPMEGVSKARRYFERYFRPFRASNRGREEGLFTGYYEPLLSGSRRPAPPYLTPLYCLPQDMVEGEPYYSRAEIYRGALSGKGLEILWVNDPVDAFFLEIQGSGRVRMDTGETVRLGFAGKNNHSYASIGKWLVDQGYMTKEEASLFSIKAWLRAHPHEAQQVMEQNPAYVFFQERQGDGPIGAEGSVLTPERSLAIDSGFLPYGVPVYLETDLPPQGLEYDANPKVVDEKGDMKFTFLLDLMPNTDPYFRRLLIAQDRGGAIKGPVRGDVFFGAGSRAETYAGYMKQQGRYALLLPLKMAERLGWR